MNFNFKNLSFTSKILFKIIVAFIIIYSLLIAIEIYKTKTIAINQAKELIESKSNEYANLNKAKFEIALNTLKTLVYSYQGINNINPNERRNFINQSLKNTLETNPDFIGIGLIWESNTLDGLDSSFVNTSGNSKTGRYLPYFNRTNNIISIQQSDYSETSNWYVKSKNTLQDFIDEPYFSSIKNKEVLVIKVSTPILIDGDCNGVLYADISLENLQKINNQLRIYKSGYGQLISNKGIILSHPFKRFINQSHEDFNDSKNEIFEAIEKGNYFYSIGNSAQTNCKALKAYTPIKIGNSITSIVFCIYVPYYEITRIENALILKMILSGFVGLMFLIIIIWLIIKAMTKSLVVGTQAVKIIATKGSIEKANNNFINPKDEINQMPVFIDKLLVELNKKVEFANEIKAGNLEYNYNKQSNEDVFGISLLEVKQSLIKSAAEEKLRKIEDEKRNWAAEGLAKFADILRNNNNDIGTLTYEVIHNLVKYINANQGGVFLINEEDTNHPYLELIGCYAYDRHKYVNKKILIGEGLVGSCYLEKQSIYLTNIPHNYINITSGLGDSNPSTVLLTPLKLNNENFGVIEMASFEKIEKYQIEFVEKVTEIIASTISSVKINMKTASLLLQSQEQAEEMKTQEEEMRQNMEELTATQESLAEKDFIKQKEIDRLNKLIEEKKSELKSKDIENQQKIESFIIEQQKIQNQNESLIQKFKQADASSIITNALYQSIATLVLDAETTIISSNDKFLQLINEPNVELKGIKLATLFQTPKNKTEFTSDLLHYIKNNRSFTEHILYSNITKDEIWLKAIFYPVFGNSNNIENIIACFYEISEEVKTQNKLSNEISDLTAQIELLKQAKEKHPPTEIEANESVENRESLTELLSQAFIKEEYAPDGKIMNVNNNFEKIYEYQIKEAKVSNVISLIPDKSKKEFKMIWDSLMRGNFFKGETSRLTKSGKEIWLSSIYIPIIDEFKKVKKIIFLANDLTESKKLKIENQKQAEKIKEFEAELKKIKSHSVNKLPNTEKKKNNIKKP